MTTNFFNEVNFETLYADSAYYSNIAISEEMIYELSLKSVNLVLKYQQKTNELEIVINPSDMIQLVRTIYCWILMEKRFGNYFKSIKYAFNDANDYKVYHSIQLEFWQRWCTLQCEFPNCWKTDIIDDENIPLFELKKDLHIKCQHYLQCFNRISEMNHLEPIYSNYMDEDRPFIVEKWF